MIERELLVDNRLGLHARASAKLVQTISPYRATVMLRHRGREVNAKSIMGLMMLAAARGSRLTVVADGADAVDAVAALEALFARRFDEDE